MSEARKPEKVFISYSHDSEIHKNRVLDLANRLREDGVDAVIDQHIEAPTQGWPRWMEKQIRDADFVLAVGSRLYHDRFLGDEEDGVGLGAKWEGAILTQHLYESDMKTKGYVPIIFEADDAQFIPMPLRPFTRYLVDGEEGYERIYRRITNQPKAKQPRLGRRRELPSIEPKSGGTMYVGGPIDVDLWNKAEWSGTFFLLGQNDEDGIVPTLGLGFKNEAAAKEILKDWHDRYGENDDEEELRISIIEGPVNGEEDGYTVHVGTEWETTYKKLSRKSRMDQNDLMVNISRLNRMTPPKGSPNLENFKKAVKRSKVYEIKFGILNEGRSEVTSMGEIGIRKARIYFRHVDEIGKHDPDSIILKSGDVERGNAS